jgi:hypothetical protein
MAYEIELHLYLIGSNQMQGAKVGCIKNNKMNNDLWGLLDWNMQKRQKSGSDGLSKSLGNTL